MSLKLQSEALSTLQAQSPPEVNNNALLQQTCSKLTADNAEITISTSPRYKLSRFQCNLQVFKVVIMSHLVMKKSHFNFISQLPLIYLIMAGESCAWASLTSVAFPFSWRYSWKCPIDPEERAIHSPLKAELEPIIVLTWTYSIKSASRERQTYKKSNPNATPEASTKALRIFPY